MKIVVIGSGGQLGSELCRQLGGDAVALDLPEFDLTDRRNMLGRLEAIAPEAVINAAAYTQVDRAEDEPKLARQINADAVATLAEACRALDCLLVQLSTDYVFGGDTHRATPYGETDPPSPLGVYGKTKLGGEQHAAGCPRHLVVRTSGLFGHGGPHASGNFVQAILNHARHKPRIEVVADQRCTPSYAPDVARAIRFLVRSSASGTIHVTNGGETTWHDFATEIVRCSGLPTEVVAISTAHYAARAPRPHYSVLDTTRYHALAGAPPMPNWRESLTEMLGSPSILTGRQGVE